MLIIGLVLGAVLRNSKHQHELTQATQQADQILADAKAEADQKAADVINSGKEQAQSYQDNSEAELTSQREDIEAREVRIKQRESTQTLVEARLDDRNHDLDGFNTELNQSEQTLKDKQAQANDLDKKRNETLSQVADLDYLSAQQMVRNRTAGELKAEQDVEVREIDEDSLATADKNARDIMIEAIQRGPIDEAREHNEHTVVIPDNDSRSKIVGHEGQHIRLIETLTGTDLVFDPEDKTMLYISTHDPIRRETARVAIEALIATRRVSVNSIETQVNSALRDVMHDLWETGERVVSKLRLGFMHPDLIKLIGRMKYRTSYGQNVLAHSVEVAQLAGIMASELNLDVRVAKRSGLLHDIGKAIDHEIEGTHVEIGTELAKAYKEDPVVINAIEASHGDVEKTSPIAVLIAAADSISGARPGARSESAEDYVNRLRSLEKIANDHEGVSDSYAIQAGREIRIVVKPQILNDDQSVELTKQVRDQIEDELTYPGKIKVTTIRQYQAVQHVGEEEKKKKRKKRAWYLTGLIEDDSTFSNEH